MLAAAGGEPPPPEPPPSADLLMYLGEFEDAQGDFVDPLALEGMHDATAVEAPEDEDETDGKDDESRARDE